MRNKYRGFGQGPLRAVSIAENNRDLSTTWATTMTDARKTQWSILGRVKAGCHVIADDHRESCIHIIADDRKLSQSRLLHTFRTAPAFRFNASHFYNKCVIALWLISVESCVRIQNIMEYVSFADRKTLVSI